MMALYSEAQRQAVLRRAAEAVLARVAGRTAVWVGGYSPTAQKLDLIAGGWCNRFVRQCFETALGRRPFSWYFGAARACLTLRKLEKYRVPLAQRQPGDILGFPGNPGHICIYLGRTFDAKKELIAENTSATRGWPRAPGTKVTAYKTLAGRVTGCYRLFPTVKK